MNIFAMFSLSGAIITFTLGLFIYAKDSNKLLNRIFMLFCISVSILSFSEFGMRQAESYDTAKFWFVLTGIFPLCAFLFFYFTLIFYKKDIFKNKKWLFPILLPLTSIIIFLNFTITIFYSNPIKTNWGFDYSFTQDVFLFYLTILDFSFSIGLIIFSILLYVKIYISSDDKIKKNQAKLISFGVTIAILTFIIIRLIIPIIIQTDNIPDLTMMSFIFTCILIRYAMWRYELFSLDLTTASERIFSTISDCLILTNSQTIILSVNQEVLKLLDYREDEIKQRPLAILLASERDQKLYQYQYQLLTDKENGGFLTDIEVDFKTKTNNKIKVSLTASKIINKKGDLRGIIHIGRNITKTRKIQQQLDEAIQKSQFKTKFMASMSHELRTPLNAIIGFVDLLLEDYCGSLNKCQNDFLSDVKLSSKDLLELINSLLDLSKIEAGELELEIHSINIETLLNHIETILKPLCRKKNLKFNIENLTTSEFINADLVRLKEILFNLLNNALKFTQKGSVTLRIKELSKWFEFNVIDTGIGIDESEYGNIFEEFKKINNPEIRDSQGMGLGLAITQHLVRLHGGQISFFSEVGKGSTFVFTIPK